MNFKGHSRSSEMSRFDGADMISYYLSIEALYCIVSHIARHGSKIAKFMHPTCIQRLRRGNQSEFRTDV